MDYIKMIRSIAGSQPLILTACSVVVLNEKNEILLQHRTDTNNWGIPGGFMELGESVEESARRELLEETGLTVGKMKLYTVFSGEDFYFTYPNGDEVYNVIVSFVSRDVSGELVADHEAHELRYFALDALPEEMIPTSRLMLERIKQDLNQGRI
ncbi:NUDIX hydrolase [Halalkalibacter akibai]|uniref:NUDIX hydrolase n=1 Tax=Halalkalibacter akibai (strain ATCC 43226 / DSM 21942 / CIP 109018 / JCM 9157 / 1139) TaxID=1236973 RepID=W4QSW2_HALA3|nr:NUDIX hydrolase [Halalkalibacter akibai]GAE34977.1 nUDIX hydrolase [Halalkalibacter akibai JCM 9157]